MQGGSTLTQMEKTKPSAALLRQISRVMNDSERHCRQNEAERLLASVKGCIKKWGGHVIKDQKYLFLPHDDVSKGNLDRTT